MFAVELHFESTVRGDTDAKVDAIAWLIAALVRSGSLLDESLVALKFGAWMVHGTTPARDAFQKAQWNEFVHQRIANLASANLKRPRIRFLGLVPETASDCQCMKRSGLFPLHYCFADGASCKMHGLQWHHSHLPASTRHDGGAFRTDFVGKQLPGM